MNGYKATVRTALYMVYLFFALLIISAIALPFIVTWYVEVKGREQTLPAVIMLTCYPCFPFAAATLLSLKRLLKNVLDGLILGDKNLSLLRVAVIACFGVTAITLGAGKLYKPFYIIAAASAACGITFLVVRSLFGMLLYKQREKELKDIGVDL